MATITYTPAYEASSGFTPAVGLDTPCGGVVSGGSVAAPAQSAVTLQVDLGSVYSVTSIISTVWWAGTGIDLQYSASSDGITWTGWAGPVGVGGVGGNHGGTFSPGAVTLSPFGSCRYWRIAYREDPQTGYTSSLLTVNAIQFWAGAAQIVPATGGTCSYCGDTGLLTVSGHYTRYAEAGSTGAVPHENCPVTLWYKSCTSPASAPCAHNPSNLDLLPGSQICIDGAISMQQTTTDCTGSYTFSLSGCITGFLVALGNYRENPAYTGCAESFVPGPYAPQWILSNDDSLPSSVAFACNADTHWKMTSNIGAVTSGSNPPGGALSAAAWIFAESDPGNGPCVGTYGSSSTCYACSYSGPGVTGLQNVPLWDSGIGQYVANPITGNWTVDLWGPVLPDVPVCYYLKDGKYYTVMGVGIVVSDSCGNTDMTYGGSGVAKTDWYNWVSGSVSLQNWTSGTCSPPLYTPFLGPDGTHNLQVQGPFDTLYTGEVQIYPNPFTMARLCLMTGLTFGVEVQPPCTGAQPERLQADMSRDILTVAWIDSPGGALKTACHRGPSRQIGSSTVDWEATQTVESANADDIGMVYLPNESLYLTYLLSGSTACRLNKSLGEGSAWMAASTPSPSVSRHSASGRGEGQAFRFRALGTSTTNGAIEFSQCRDNRGAEWTETVTVTAEAQGPWCGGIFVENAYICLYSLAQTVPGLAAAGSLCMAKSVDGGQSWTLSYTGYSGQCGGIARTKQGVLAAVVLGNTPVTSGLYPTGWLQSRNNGDGWSSDFKFGRSVPALTLPPAITAQEDIFYTVWVTGDQPQFLASRDGGVSWY